MHQSSLRLGLEHVSLIARGQCCRRTRAGQVDASRSLNVAALRALHTLAVRRFLGRAGVSRRWRRDLWRKRRGRWDWRPGIAMTGTASVNRVKPIVVIGDGAAERFEVVGVALPCQFDEHAAGHAERHLDVADGRRGPPGDDPVRVCLLLLPPSLPCTFRSESKAQQREGASSYRSEHAHLSGDLGRDCTVVPSEVVVVRQ